MNILNSKSITRQEQKNNFKNFPCFFFSFFFLLLTQIWRINRKNRYKMYFNLISLFCSIHNSKYFSRGTKKYGRIFACSLKKYFSFWNFLCKSYFFFMFFFACGKELWGFMFGNWLSVIQMILFINSIVVLSFNSKPVTQITPIIFKYLRFLNLPANFNDFPTPLLTIQN